MNNPLDLGVKYYDPPEPQKPKAVSWAFKDWKQFTEEDKVGLAAHMETFDCPLKAENYKKYLIHFCKVPAAFFQ